MNKIFFLLACLSMELLIAQSWTYKAGGNAFDGKYKTASIQGKGTYNSYHKPFIVINLFNEESLNFYVSGAGYFSSSSDVEIFWIFNNEPETLYETEDYSLSADGKTIFMSRFRNTITDEKFFQLEFIDKMISATKVDVRIKDNYGQNDVLFDLAGSRKAIDFVISKKYRAKEIADFEEYKKKTFEQINKQIKIDSIISKLILNEGVLIEEIPDVLDEIDSTFDIYSLNMADIVSISLTKVQHGYNLKLYDTNTNLIKEITHIEIKMGKTIELWDKKKEQYIQTSIDRITSLVNSYDLTDQELEVIKKEIRSYFLAYMSFDLDEQIEKLDRVETATIKKHKDQDWGSVHFMSSNGDQVFYVDMMKNIPIRVLEGIVKGKIESASNKIIEFIKKYELTDEENLKVVKMSLIPIEVYFNYDMSLIKNIELEVIEKSSKDIEIKFTKSDDSVKKFQMNDNKEIAKKVKKLQNQI